MLIITWAKISGAAGTRNLCPNCSTCLTRPESFAYVDLDGGWGEHLLNAHLEHFKQPAPERFLIFGGVDWSQWQEKGNSFPEWAAGRLRVQKERGAEGLKIWKGLGLYVRDHRDQLVDVDDPRLDPIWETAGNCACRSSSTWPTRWLF